MYEDLYGEQIVEKVGGRFKLSTLLQKRIVQLNRGSKPLVDSAGHDNLHIAIREVMEERIYLDTDNNLRVAPSPYGPGGAPDDINFNSM